MVMGCRGDSEVSSNLSWSRLFMCVLHRNENGQLVSQSASRWLRERLCPELLSDPSLPQVLQLVAIFRSRVVEQQRDMLLQRTFKYKYIRKIVLYFVGTMYN